MYPSFDTFFESFRDDLKAITIFWPPFTSFTDKITIFFHSKISQIFTFWIVGNTGFYTEKRDAIFVLISKKIENLWNTWKWLQKLVFCNGKWTLVKKTSFWLASLVKEASNSSEIRCFPHDIWSKMINIVTRMYFLLKRQWVSWLFG